MNLVTGVMDSLIAKLGELLKEEHKLQKGLPDKIGSLIKELECARSALRKVAGVPPDQLEEQVRIWAHEVREASYDMEDVLDTFLVSAQDDPKPTDHESLFESFKKKMASVYNMVVSGPFKRRKIALTIDDINKTLKEVTKRHRRYTLDSIVFEPSPMSIVDPRLAAMYKEVTQLVGIDKSSDDLISILSLQGNDESQKKMMKMVSVIGVGGLGKTTLVKAVYDKLKVDFDCTAFVSVGRDPDLKKVFLDLLIELDKEKYMDSKYTILDVLQLIKELRKYLGSKRYLVVIDDIWETESWERIKWALVEKNSGSRAITTSRKLDVAKQADEFYELQPLPYEKSRKLFYTRIFGADRKCHDTQLDEASDKMLKKCDGIPLAIITMASLLVGKSREQWIEVCHSIVFRDEKNQQVSDTEWILSLSYYDLPAHLRTCLLYLSVFPEDYVIHKDPLIRKWIAEGFVHDKKPGTSLFEVGEGYFNELVNRSMIQVVEPRSSIAIGCRLHDMVLDLLRLKSQEENFITISRNTIVEGSRVRRLVHQNKTVEQIHQDGTGKDLRHVRTFIACSSGTITNTVLSFQSFQLLRVLAFEDFYFTGHIIRLEHIEKLLHLRYLGLTGASFYELPEGIGALKFLQTLDLEQVNFESGLPSSLGLLTQLTCLRAGFEMVPNGVLDKLTSLEVLKIALNPDMVWQFAKDLRNLRELRVLEAFVRGSVEESYLMELVESIGSLHKIRHIQLVCRFERLVEAPCDTVVLPRPLQRLIAPNMLFTALPSCINPSDLPNLTHLDLRVSYLDEQGLKNLGTLPELRHLELQTWSTVTITTHAAADGCFHKLRSCYLFGSTTLFVLNEDLSVSFTIWSNWDDVVAFGSQKGIVQAPAIMPNLQVLYFSVNVQALIRNNGNCDKLGLEYLPSLQEVQVDFNYKGPLADEEKEALRLRHAIEAHPNRPTLKIVR